MYGVFSQTCPEHDVLWKKLIAEEQMHAEAVRKLYGLTYQGKVLFDEGTIKHAGIRSIIDYIRSISDSAGQRRFTAVQLISHSLDIEKSLIERKLFDHFTVSPEFANLLRILQQGSESHGALVEGELAKITNKSNPTNRTKTR
jgi:hypothetical protein